jgi:hypothetical protein
MKKTAITPEPAAIYRTRILNVATPKLYSICKYHFTSFSECSAHLLFTKMYSFPRPLLAVAEQEVK